MLGDVAPGQSFAATNPAVSLVALGDSITLGTRDGVKEEESFCGLMRSDGALLDRHLEIVCKGVCSDTTERGLARFDQDVTALKPSVVVVMFGTNDSFVDPGKTEPNVTRSKFNQNLDLLVRRVKRLGAKPILMTPPRWGDQARPNGVGENPNVRLEPYIEEARAVARSEQVPLVDIFRFDSECRAAGMSVDRWTTDGCHPNPAGHRVISALLVPVVLAMLGAN